MLSIGFQLRGLSPTYQRTAVVYRASRSLSTLAINGRRYFVKDGNQQRQFNSLPQAKSSFLHPAGVNSAIIRPLRNLSTSPPSNNDTAKEKPQKKGIMAMFKEYGFPFLIYESVAWLGSGAVVYVGVSAAGGYEHVLPLLKNAGLDQYVHLDTLDPRYGNLAITIAINETLEIIRFPFVVATTPKVVQWWRSRRS